MKNQRGGYPAALLIIGLAALLLFAKPLFSGGLPFPAHTKAFLPWRADLDADSQAAVQAVMNREVTDKHFAFHPDNHVAYRAFQAGRLPLWNPYQMAGLPYLGQSLYGVFYPLNLPMFIFSPERCYAPLAALHFLLAGFFTYLLLRRLGISHAAALAGGLIFMCSVNMTARFHYYMTLYPMVWAPLMLYLVHRYHRDRSRLSLCGLAAVSALTLLTGFQQTAAYVFYLTLIFSLYWAAKDRYRFRFRRGALAAAAVAAVFLAAWAAGMNPWRAYTFGILLAVAAFFAAGTGFIRWAASAVPVGLAMVLGAGLSAVQLLPVVALMPLSTRLPINPLDMIHLSHLPGAGLLGLLMPTLLNDPMWSPSSSPFNFAGLALTGNVTRLVFTENSLYIGILPLALIPFCGYRGENQGKALFLTVLCMVCLAVALGLSLVIFPYWLNPPFRYGDPRRILLVFSFLASLLAAFGFERVRLGLAGTRGPRALALGLLGLAAVSATWGALGAYPTAEMFRHKAENRAASVPELAVHFQEESGTVEEAIEDNARQVRASLLYLALAAALGGAALLCLGLRPGRFALVLVCLVILADLVPLSWRMNQPQEPEGFLSLHPSIALMQSGPEEGPYRIFRYTEDTRSAARIPLPPNMTTHFDLEDVEGHVAQPLKRFFALLNAVQPDPPIAPVGSAVWPLSRPESLRSPIIDLLGVRFFITTRTIPEDMGYKMCYGQEGIFVYENTEAFPRAFLVRDGTFFDPEGPDMPGAVLEAVLSPETDLRSTAILEGSPGRFLQTEGPLPDAKVRYPRPEEAEITFDGPVPGGYLVLTDAYYPGWKAEVDGDDSEVFPADLAFRAVAIPSGARKVVFRFDPPEVKVGMAVSLLSGAALLALVLFLVFKKERQPPGSQP